MSSVMITHEVEDVDHWVSSSKRNELFPALRRVEAPRAA
jgi:hypothetical protein